MHPLLALQPQTLNFVSLCFFPSTRVLTVAFPNVSLPHLSLSLSLLCDQAPSSIRLIPARNNQVWFSTIIQSRLYVLRFPCENCTWFHTSCFFSLHFLLLLLLLILFFFSTSFCYLFIGGMVRVGWLVKWVCFFLLNESNFRVSEWVCLHISWDLSIFFPCGFIFLLSTSSWNFCLLESACQHSKFYYRLIAREIFFVFFNGDCERYIF